MDKIVVRECEKKDGKRSQDIDIYYSYVGIVDIPTDEEMREMEWEYGKRTKRQTNPDFRVRQLQYAVFSQYREYSLQAIIQVSGVELCQNLCKFMCTSILGMADVLIYFSMLY